jgi:hypothetical protein
MKRLAMCLVMLAMLGVCSSSSGVILVYKLKASGSGIDVNNGNLPAKISMQGYLVMNINDAGTVLSDAALVIYGKDASTPKPQKVYVELYMNDANAFLDLNIERDGDYRVIDFVANTGPFDFESITIGKLVTPFKGVNIQCVAKTKGAVWVRDGMLLDPDHSIRGTGTITASLDVKDTTAIYQEGWTMNEVIVTGKTIDGKHYNGVRGILEAKGFQRYSPVP